MKKKIGAKKRLRAYFLSNIGRVLKSDELQKVAGISEWARRVRELRSEEGYEILTHTDRAELKVDEYRLDNPKPKPAFARQISKETRAYVLNRNGFTCQQCGAGAGEPHPYDPTRKTRLHLGHIIDKSAGGTDDAGNLRALCSICNEGSANVALDPPSQVKLFSHVRRAKVADQLALLEWLKMKFPRHGS